MLPFSSEIPKYPIPLRTWTFLPYMRCFEYISSNCFLFQSYFFPAMPFVSYYLSWPSVVVFPCWSVMPCRAAARQTDRGQALRCGGAVSMMPPGPGRRNTLLLGVENGCWMFLARSFTPPLPPTPGSPLPWSLGIPDLDCPA